MLVKLSDKDIGFKNLKSSCHKFVTKTSHNLRLFASYLSYPVSILSSLCTIEGVKMSYLKSGSAFKYFDSLELSICVFFNRISRWENIRKFFSVISRLGNGVFWYVLMAVIAISDYPVGGMAAVHMAVVGLIGLLIYKVLKTQMVRQRPYIQWEQIINGTAPLDLYSFPSGHTLHAVAFTCVALFYYPSLFWLLIPFASLVALSRVILGLHYPTDVLVGAGLGFAVAYSSLSIFG